MNQSFMVGNGAFTVKVNPIMTTQTLPQKAPKKTPRLFGDAPARKGDGKGFWVLRTKTLSTPLLRGVLGSVLYLTNL